MKRIIAVVVLTLFIASPVFAGEPKFRIGAGTHTMVIHNDSLYYPDFLFVGAALSGRISFNDNVGMYCKAYSAQDIKYDIDIVGVEAGMLFGLVANDSFNLYVGPLVFREEASLNGAECKMSGFGANIGTGYTWEKLALNFDICFRSPNDYEGDDEKVKVVTSSLTLSFVL